MSAPARKLEVGRVGDVVPRADGIPKTTGEFAYASDLQAAGMLWGHTVRSPHAHALVREIDIAEAVSMPGVHAVLTHADIPGTKVYGLEYADQPVLAIDRVRYHGEPVALVAAEHPEQARRAAERVRVAYEPLEPVVDMERALEQEELHPDRPTHEPGHYRDDPRSNIVRSILIRHGDPDAPGDVTVSGEYELGIQDQAFLGPESGLAVPDGEGGVDIYVATQWLHVDRGAGRAVSRPAAGAGADPPGRRRRCVRRPGGSVDADPRRAARPPHGPAGEVRLHPRGVVRRARAPPPRTDPHGAPCDPRRHARLRPRARPARRRRLRVELDGRDDERGLVRLRSVRRPERARRGGHRLHEQPALRRDARIRRRAGVLRTRGADGQAGRRARARPRRPSAAERALDRRRHAERAGRHRVAPGRRGDPTLRGAAAARARGAAPRSHSAPGRVRERHARGGRPARRGVRGRLQEPLLLARLRRLLRGPRPSLHRRRRPARRRGALRRRRGRPGRGRCDRPGGPDGARAGRGDARAAHDGDRRLGGIGLGLAHDLDGLRGGGGGVPRGAGRARCARRDARSGRRDRRGARVSASADLAARPRDGPGRSGSARTSRSSARRCARSSRWTPSSG